MTKTLGIILAGGKATRFGANDKAFALLQQKPLINWVVDRLKPQVEHLAISSNQNTETYQHLGLQVLPDQDLNVGGPMAGILSAMHHAELLSCDAVISASVDTPFIPTSFASALISASRGHDEVPIVATSNSRWHPTCALWPVSLKHSLIEFLNNGNSRARSWLEEHHAEVVDFGNSGFDPFWNINTHEDLNRAEFAAQCLAND